MKVGSTVVFSINVPGRNENGFLVPKSRLYRGSVLSIDADGDAIVSWPTMRYRGEKGVVCSHMIPSLWVREA